MRKTKDPDDLRSEYTLDYTRSSANRFAGRSDRGRLVVALDPDVSKVFTSAESVNVALRALIQAIPRTPRRTRTVK